MNPYEVESQLSAMFDGELPGGECELLSRRLDRDEALRVRWSRYALIGAAMRSEPVAAARNGFAARVSAALDAEQGREARQRTVRRLRTGALAASLVAAVAGGSLALLRYATPGSTTLQARVERAADGTSAATIAASTLAPVPAVSPISARPSPVSVPTHSSNEPVSYVTPSATAGPAMALRTQLADYIVAHSEYSSPLMRRNLLSELVSNEFASDFNADGALLGATAAPAAAPADHVDAPRALPSPGR